VPAPDFEGWTCPLPLRDSPQIVMGHGGGGAMTAELIEHLFLPALANERPDRLGDSAVLDLGGARIAFSTDSFVVRPLFFPGGSIGDLAVNGTVNDLAMSGAQPAYLSAGSSSRRARTSPWSPPSPTGSARGTGGRGRGRHR
jgi:hydrogenase expression/formation protein HypE